MTRFDDTIRHPHYYGRGTENVIDCTDAEAYAVNNIRIREVKKTRFSPKTFEVIFRGVKPDSNDFDVLINAYKRITSRINDYLENHDVYPPEDDKTETLRPM